MLSGLRAVVSSDGEHGENLIREDEAGFTITLTRPVRDLRKQLPNIEVRPLRRQQWSGTTRARQRELVASAVACAMCHIHGTHPIGIAQ